MYRRLSSLRKSQSGDNLKGCRGLGERLLFFDNFRVDDVIRRLDSLRYIGAADFVSSGKRFPGSYADRFHGL